MFQIKKIGALLLALVGMIGFYASGVADIRETDLDLMESKHFLFDPELVAENLSLENMRQFFGMLDAAYEAGIALTGNTPGDEGQMLIAYDALGVTDVTEGFNCIEDGSTLLRSSTSFGKLLRVYESEEKIDFRLFHELGHYFATDPHIGFHNELFADFVGLYMVIQTGANVYSDVDHWDGTVKRIDGAGANFVQNRLEYETEQALTNPDPGNLLWLIYEPILEAYGYQPFQDAFLYFVSEQPNSFVPATYENAGEPNGVGDAAQAHTFMEVLSHFTPDGLESVVPADVLARFAKEWKAKKVSDTGSPAGQKASRPSLTTPGSSAAPNNVTTDSPRTEAPRATAIPNTANPITPQTPTPQATPTPRGVTGVHETDWGTMESDHFIFLPDVVKENLSPENIQKFFGILDAAYKAGTELLGNGPSNGAPINITHNFENTGLPEGFYSTVGGNTLFLSATGFGDLLRVFEEEGKIDFRLFHEIGHSFTLDPRLGLSNELFAHFVGMYMVGQIDADVYSDVEYWDGRGTRIEGTGTEYSEKRLEYETEWAHGEPDPSNLLWLIYGPVLEAYGYQPFQDAFRYFTQGETDGFLPNTYVSTGAGNGVGNAMQAHAFMEILSHFTPGGLESVVSADVLDRFAREWKAEVLPRSYYAFDVAKSYSSEISNDTTLEPSPSPTVSPQETAFALACGVASHSLSDGWTHRTADCKKAGHFDCDGKYHFNSACGKTGHFECDGQDHTNRCGAFDHSMCDGKSHADATCGNYNHYVCDGKSHTRGACGTSGHNSCDYPNEPNYHDRAACNVSGHYNCAAPPGGSHTKASCGITGHLNCDGRYHGPEKCGVSGHFNCDGRSHSRPVCGISGHFDCDGKDHGRADCLISGHRNCDGNDHNHAICGVSGHRNNDGKSHAPGNCGISGHVFCDGQNHSNSQCGVYGHTNCDGRDHGNASCGINGHTNCDGQSHGGCNQDDYNPIMNMLHDEQQNDQPAG